MHDQPYTYTHLVLLNQLLVLIVLYFDHFQSSLVFLHKDKDMRVVCGARACMHTGHDSTLEHACMHVMQKQPLLVTICAQGHNKISNSLSKPAAVRCVATRELGGPQLLTCSAQVIKGATSLQGPHQGAQKSTSTGPSACMRGPHTRTRTGVSVLPATLQP